MWRHLLSSPKLFTIMRTLLPETALQTMAHRKILLPPPTRGLLLASLLKQTVSLSTSTQSPSSDLSNTNESKHSRNTNYESNNKTPSSDSNGLVITCEEAKRMMRLVNVEDLKLKLAMEDRECVSYNELITSCQSMGVARSFEEAVAFVRVLDDAGVVFLFRDKVYLQPHKVINLVKRALPVALTPEDDPLREELKRLCEKKKEIDALAHKYVRRILWCGLGFAVTQLLLFFRLTYWEFSWDVLEPVAFFVTTSGLVVGYAYFLCTAKDPTYQDLRKRLFLSRQRKLFKKLDFDIKRYKELERKFSKRLDSHVLDDALNDD